MGKSVESDKKTKSITVVFSSDFYEKMDQAYRNKGWRNRQELIRRATEDLTEKILDEVRRDNPKDD